MRAVKRCVSAWWAIGLGMGLMAWGALFDGIDGSDLRAAGTLCTLTAIAWTMTRKVSKPTGAAYELGHRDGYREGYEDGRQVAKPTVVQLRPCQCGRPEVAVSRRSP